jgi:hypothetical protein
MRMIANVHNLQLPFLCQLSNSAPNILWSVGSVFHNQPLQVARSNPAVIIAKVSLQLFFEGHIKGRRGDVCRLPNAQQRQC